MSPDDCEIGPKQAEEAQLLQQQQARAVVDAAAENGELPDMDPLTSQDPTAARVAQQNGERESLGVSSGVLQVFHYPGTCLCLKSWCHSVMRVGCRLQILLQVAMHGPAVLSLTTLTIGTTC